MMIIPWGSAIRSTRWLGMSVTLTLLLPTPALAHSVGERFGDFYGGILHPLTALEHLLAFIAIGLLAGQQKPKTARWMLLAFPLGLLLGCLGAFWSEPVPAVPLVNRCSFVVVGALVAVARPVPRPLLIAIGVLFGITHGYENGVGMTSGLAWHLYSLGIVLSGIALVALAAAVAVSLRVAWQRIAIRVVGSWIAAIGILMLGLA